MAAYPGGDHFSDTASRVEAACASLAIWDLMLAVSPSLADLAAEKLKVGTNIKLNMEDER